VRSSELFNCLVGGLIVNDRSSAVAVVPDPVPLVPGPDADTSRGRLLLVEDNPINQLVATRMLVKLGYEVDVAENGQAALDATEMTAYDAVLMDCQMPEMDGYQATAAIRRREGGARHTPIIAMTAAAMEGDRDVCIAAGMDDYLAKPVRTELLVEVLDRWVDRGSDGDGPESDPAGGAESVTDAEPPPLDAERFEAVRELDDGGGVLFRTLAREFAADSRRRVDTLRDALDEDDPGVVERTAHTLKGASAAIGAVGLADLCAQLETMGRERALVDGGDLLVRIDRELDRVRDALDHVVAGS
jgi:CheY-like chemotaxis protein/HPt (histidine-containing phosphotransfer) domain-containing protein